MDVIPFLRFVAAIFIGGLSFYFFFLILFPEVNSILPVSNIYFNAMLSICTGIPAAVLFRSGIKLIMHMQKRSF